MEGKTKITDFGEKIGGARKDNYVSGINVNDIEDLNHKELLKYCVKKNVWKKPDYEAIVKRGVEKEVAYFYKLAYDSFPTKIKSTGNYEKDKEIAKNYINLGKSLSLVNVDSYIGLDKLQSTLIEYGFISRGTFSFRQTEKSYGIDLTRFFNKLNKVNSNWERKKIRERIEEINFPYKQEVWQKGVFIKESKERSSDGEKLIYNVCKREGSYAYVKQVCNSKEEAERYINVTLKKEYEEKKAKKVDIEVRPQLKHIVRKGIDIRGNSNVTTDKFQETFKFRGGEFGNWNNQDDRQQNLNLAYDSLFDLAKVLNVSESAISLDGTLAIAFGSRGKGKAVAHYEPSSVVINLTKMRGAGSLAHEWGHAFDDYLGKKVGVKNIDSYLSKNYKSNMKTKFDLEVSYFEELMESIKYKYLTEEEIRKSFKEKTANTKDKYFKVLGREFKRNNINLNEVKENYKEYFSLEHTANDYEKNLEILLRNISIDYSQRLDGIDRKFLSYYINDIRQSEKREETAKDKVGILKGETDYYKNAKELDTYRSKAYFSTDVELFARAFETYVETKLKDSGYRSDYLVYGTTIGNIAYPNKEDLNVIVDKFDSLFNELSILEKGEYENSYNISDVSYLNKDFKEKSNDLQKEESSYNDNVKKEKYYITSKDFNEENIKEELKVESLIQYSNCKNICGIVEAFGEFETMELSNEEIEKFNLISDSDIYDKFENKLKEQDLLEEKSKKDISELLEKADSFKFAKFRGDITTMFIAIPNLDINSSSDYKVVYAIDDGKEIKCLSHSKLSKDEFINRLVEYGYESKDCIEKLNINDLKINEVNEEKVDTKNLMEIQELQKHGSIAIISINNDKLELTKNLNQKYTIMPGDKYSKLIVLKEEKEKALESLGVREKEVGNIRYTDIKKQPGLNKYILVSKSELDKIIKTNMKYAAFKKDDNKYNVVVKEKDFNKVLGIIERKHELTLGNISFSELKKNNDILYRNYSKTFGEKVIEKLKDKEIKHSAINKDNKILMAIRKEDNSKVQLIVNEMKREFNIHRER